MSLARPARAGFTLVEVMVSLVVLAVLTAAAGPYLGDYVANARLRGAGQLLFNEALMAQSEAAKRNTRVELRVTAAATSVVDVTDTASPVTLRSRELPPGVSSSVVTVRFGSEGRPLPFGTEASIDVSATGQTCSTELRCPGVRITAGGAMRLCADRTATC